MTAVIRPLPAGDPKSLPNGASDSAVPVDLQGHGLLWLINRTVFHPRGYALGYDADSGDFVLLGDGSEPWTFCGDGSDEAEHLASVKMLMP